MRKLQYNLCGGPLTVQAGGQRAVCGNCGLEYPMERLRNRPRGDARQAGRTAGGQAVSVSAAGWLCCVLNRLRAEWPATVLLVTDHAEYLDALEADVVQLPQAEPVFDALWEPLPDTL